MDTQQNQQLEINSSESQVVEQVTTRKPFVEPEISSPVDVLEATTFQQTTTSFGTTN